MVQCERCSQSLTYADGELRCPVCGRVWNEVLLGDERYFCKSFEDDYNSLIAYEYQKLKAFIINKQIYGAILQIKDIYEVLIKFPVLLGASYLFHNKSSDENDPLLVNIVTTRNSMGDWNSHLALMQKKIRQMDELADLHEIAKLTDVFCRRNQVVSWRNKNIGHGATKEMNDGNLYEDLFARIEGITAFLAEVKPHYDKIKLAIHRGEQSDELVGHRKIFAEQAGKPVATFGNKVVELEPFFYIVDDGLYFYDNFIAKKSYLDIVEYPRGKRDMKSTHIFDDICNGQSDNVSVDGGAISHTEIEVSNNVLNVTDFIEPKFITRWIEDRMDNDDKVFMLRMQRGMGKSTLIRALDPFQLDRIMLPSTSVRTYYINPTYGSKVNDFLREVDRQLSQDDEGRSLRGDFYFPQQSGPDPRLELAKALNQAKSMPHLACSNLLFIIDGLDELRSQNGLNISDFIPTADMLDDGVFVLLTSRTLLEDDKVTLFTKSLLQELSQLPTLELHVGDEQYLQLKKQYFDEHIVKELHETCKRKKVEFVFDENAKEQFLQELADDSMLYLRQLKELLLIKTTNLIEQGAKLVDCSKLLIHDNASLLDEYFASLKSNYGDKYFRQFSRLMVALTLADDYLTVNDLAVLVANGNLSLGFMGFLNTIRMFLTVKRTNYGNAYRISHLENIRYIREHLSSDTLDMAEELYRKMSFILDGGSVVDYSDKFAMTYFAYLLNVARTFRLLDSPTNYQSVLDMAHALLMNQRLLDVSDYFEEQLLDRNIMYQRALTRYAEKHCDKSDKNEQLAVARSLMISGGFRFAQRDVMPALEDFKGAFEIVAKLPLTDDEKFEFYFSKEPVYLYLLSDLKQYEMILTYADYVDKIFDDLKSRNYSFTPASLAYHASMRGYYYQMTKQWDKSLSYEMQAVAALEHYSDNEEKWLYAARLSNAGKTLTQVGQTDKALEYLTRAATLYDECVADGYIRYVKEIWFNCRRLCTLHLKLCNFDKAIETCWTGIRYVEQKERENLLSNKVFIPNAYWDLAEVYFTMGDVDNCRKYLDETVTKLNQLDEAQQNKTGATVLREKIEQRYKELN